MSLTRLGPISSFSVTNVKKASRSSKSFELGFVFLVFFVHSTSLAASIRHELHSHPYEPCGSALGHARRACGATNSCAQLANWLRST